MSYENAPEAQGLLWASDWLQELRGEKNDEHAYVWPMQYVCMSRRRRKRDTDKEREMGREEQLLCFSVVIWGSLLYSWPLARVGWGSASQFLTPFQCLPWLLPPTSESILAVAARISIIYPSWCGQDSSPHLYPWACCINKHTNKT